jgi:hypothetical protein
MPLPRADQNRIKRDAAIGPVDAQLSGLLMAE